MDVGDYLKAVFAATRVDIGHAPRKVLRGRVNLCPQIPSNKAPPGALHPFHLTAAKAPAGPAGSRIALPARRPRRGRTSGWAGRQTGRWERGEGPNTRSASLAALASGRRTGIRPPLSPVAARGPGRCKRASFIERFSFGEMPLVLE
jgi:hypothetical protein